MELKVALSKIAEALGASFTLHNKPIANDEVFSELGLLPALARRADQLCSLCLGYGIGVSFDEADKAILGSRSLLMRSPPRY